MNPISPYASPYTNRPVSWHRGEYLNHSVHDDSGYASEDSDSVPFLSLDPHSPHGDIDLSDYNSPWTQRHRATAFIDAQWSRLGIVRARYPSHDPFNNRWGIHDLPQTLAFEQQCPDYGYGSRLRPTTRYSRENLGHGHGFTASGWEWEENTSSQESEEDRARVPDILPSLNDRIENEIELASPPASPIRHDSPNPEVKLKAPQSRGLTKSAPTDNRTKNTMRSSAQHQHQHHPSSHDANLATAWQDIYQERMELEKDRRALDKKGRSMLKQKRRPRSKRQDRSDNMAGERLHGAGSSNKTTEEGEDAAEEC